MGVKVPTYVHHENGRSGLSRAGERYAKFFRVNLEWLLTGKGPMRGQSIPVMGKVCAGAHVEYFDKSAPPENIELIDPKRLAALQVDGKLMYPRFYPGEFVLFDLENVPPATLLNQYAVVQTLEGERLIKILREGRAPGLYTLELHSHLAIRDVQLLAAYRYLGVIPNPGLFLPPKRKRR